MRGIGDNTSVTVLSLIASPVIVRLIVLSLALAAAEPFASHQFVAADGTTLPYRLLAPPVVRPGTRYPLVLQLHGSGAIGTDNHAQIGAFANGWLRPDV